MDITTQRSNKRAYFSDLEGGNILEFQFSPADLSFTEAGAYADRVSTGNFFTDLVWISGKPNTFNLRFFIDRTQESYVSSNFDADPFSKFRRFPNENTRGLGLDVVNLIKGIATSNTSSGFATSFAKKNTDTAKQVDPSNYSASPHYIQNQFNDQVGVINDLESLMYYVRPKGLELSRVTVNKDGSVNVKDFEQSRFVPPPMVRFYYGNMWREGYIVEVKYNLSVVNKNLVPRRLDANIKMACTKWGYLNEINSSVGANRSAVGVQQIEPDGDEYVSRSPRRF